MLENLLVVLIAALALCNALLCQGAWKGPVLVSGGVLAGHLAEVLILRTSWVPSPVGLFWNPVHAFNCPLLGDDLPLQ